jgi:Tfp pilus assembly protein PilO
MKTNNILLTVALIAIAGFGIVPLRQMTLEKEIENERLFIQKQNQIERLTELENAQKITGNQSAIPMRPEQLSFVDDITRIAKKNGISLPESWNFSLGRNSEVNAEQISISFPVSGTRAQIQQFLQEIEQNPRFMGVKNFSFTTDSSRTTPRIDMSIDLYAFFLEV